MISCDHLCDCVCHKKPGVLHVMACCYVCKICEQNIGSLDSEVHKANCHKEMSIKNIAMAYKFAFLDVCKFGNRLILQPLIVARADVIIFAFLFILCYFTATNIMSLYF